MLRMPCRKEVFLFDLTKLQTHRSFILHIGVTSSYLRSGCHLVKKAQRNLKMRRTIEATAYCSCGHCCKWEWGLKLPGNFYLGFCPSLVFVRIRRRVKGVQSTNIPLVSKFWTHTNLLGQPYRGMTARGTFPAQARPAILSPLSLRHPEKILGRLLLFPWRLLPRSGTIAADTKHYPFGTRMFVPGYGWGTVEDRGSAIQGPVRIDLYHKSHREALLWGRRKVEVLVLKPGESLVDHWPLPGPIKAIVKALDWTRRLIL